MNFLTRIMDAIRRLASGTDAARVEPLRGEPPAPPPLPDPPTTTPTLAPLRIDPNGWLVGEGVVCRPAHSSWYYATERLRTPSGQPAACIWHYTATNPGTALAMHRRREAPREIDAGSWHVTVAHDGLLWQAVPFTRGAFHCKAGTIAVAGTAIPPNRCTVGIELEGHGKAYTPVQIRAAERLLRALVDAYGWSRVACAYEHRMFDPTRRSDCGPPWSTVYLPAIIESIFTP